MTDARVSNGGSPSGFTTSLGLLDRVKAREPAAWERFVALYSPLVDYWCLLGRIPERDRPDVRQDVFLAVARKIGDFRKEPERGSLRGWLRTVTRSKVADLHRRNPAEVPVGGTSRLELLAGLADPFPAADESTEASIVYSRALALIERDFEPATWRAFWLVVVEDRSAADAAAELGITANAVYLAKARVLRRLRE